jgi:uncharacterized protein YndB with AHSA1/START domain
MTDAATAGAHGTLIEPATLRIERVLPGPIERIWAYLTESELRRKWLAAGEMELRIGAPFELVWRNDELTDPPGTRPEGFAAEHRLQGEITEVDPPRRLAITWGSSGGVTFTLEPQGRYVLLGIVHRRLPDRGMLLKVSAGWHTHLDVLAARVAGETPASFWDSWQHRHEEYRARLPG